MLLLAAVIFNMTGFFIVFKIEQSIVRKNIKRQIKAGVPNNQLFTFHMSRSDYNELDWVKANKEFKKDQNMFDVVKLESTKDSVTLFCINDRQEKELFARLDQAVQNQMERESNASNGPLNKSMKFLKLVYQSPHWNLTLNHPSTKGLNLRTHFPNSYTSPFLEMDVPPPNLFS